MKTVKSTTIEEGGLQERPRFYTSPSGSGSIDRLDGNMEVGSAVFPIAKLIRVKFDVDTTDVDEVTHTVSHKLGFKPYVMGTYIFDKIGEYRIFQDVMDPNYKYTGKVYIESVTNNDLTIAVQGFYYDGFDSNPIIDTITLKLFLLNIPIL